MANLRLKKFVDDLNKVEEQFFDLSADDICQWNSPNHVSRIVQKLRKVKTVHNLKVESRRLIPEAAKFIASALRYHGEIRKLSLKNAFNELCDEYMFLSINRINLGLNLAHIKLFAFDLSGNHFNLASCKVLRNIFESPVCHNLQELSLAECNLGDKEIKIMAEGLLTSKVKLLKLHLSGNPLKSKGSSIVAKTLAKMKTLQEVKLANCLIGAKGIKPLALAFMKNPKLQIIDLNSNGLCDRGVLSLTRALPSNVKLRSLLLSRCQIDRPGCRALTELLKGHLPEIELIDLSFNFIDSCAAYSLILALKHKSLLDHLNLKGNPVHYTAFREMARTFSTALRPDALSDIYNYSIKREYDSNLLLDIELRTSLARLEDAEEEDSNFDNAVERFCLYEEPCSLSMLNAITAWDKLNAFEKVFQLYKDDEYTLVLCFTAMKCANLSDISSEAAYLGKQLFKKLIKHAIAIKQEVRIRNHLLKLLRLLQTGVKFHILYNVEVCRNVLKTALNELEVSYQRNTKDENNNPEKKYCYEPAIIWNLKLFFLLNEYAHLINQKFKK